MFLNEPENFRVDLPAVQQCIGQTVRSLIPRPRRMFYLTEALRVALLPLFPTLEPLDLYMLSEIGQMLAKYFFAGRAKFFPNGFMNYYVVGHTDLADHLGRRDFPSSLLRKILWRLIIPPLCEQNDRSRKWMLSKCLLEEYNEAVREVFPLRYHYFC